MVTFDTGTNFPAVRWNSLLAAAMMNIRLRWNGVGVLTQSHPNAASLTLSAWNISISVQCFATCGNFSSDLWCFQSKFALYRILMKAYQIRNTCIYYITNNMQRATSNRFPGKQLRLSTSLRRANTNNYGITVLLHGTGSFSRNHPFSTRQVSPILWNPKFLYIVYNSHPIFLTLRQIIPVYGPQGTS